MPTPFQHLTYAISILETPQLPRAFRVYLCQEAGAFLLGNTAADVQTLTGQPRDETHFYRLSTVGHTHATEVMLEKYPKLRASAAMAPAHFAFISGYLAHLTWDEVWADEVFIPFYYHSPRWQDRLTRSVHHNALRVLLDRQAERQLRARPDLSTLVRDATPHNWLPFVEDDALCRWRDWLVTQLTDPDKVETAQVFARRMQISVEDLENVILSVAQGTYTPTIPGLQHAIAKFELRARAEALDTLSHYWQNKV